MKNQIEKIKGKIIKEKKENTGRYLPGQFEKIMGKIDKYGISPIYFPSFSMDNYKWVPSNLPAFQFERNENGKIIHPLNIFENKLECEKFCENLN